MSPVPAQGVIKHRRYVDNFDILGHGRPIEPKISIAQSVIDYTGDVRPAFIVNGHCRNCRVSSCAMFSAGTVVPLYVFCPYCKTIEFSAHDGFFGLQDLSWEELDRVVDDEFAEARRKYQEAMS